VTQVKLDYALGDLEPAIDNKTMNFHYGTHYKAYVDNLNKATAAATNDAKSRDLTSE
jgi:Fe-Mn family superoxide dismutase